MCSCCLLLLVFPSLFIERTSLLKWLHLTIIFTHVIASVLLYSSVVYLEGDARYTSGEFFLLCSRRLSKLITFTFLCCTLSHLPLLVDFFLSSAPFFSCSSFVSKHHSTPFSVLLFGSLFCLCSCLSPCTSSPLSFSCVYFCLFDSASQRD